MSWLIEPFDLHLRLSVTEVYQHKLLGVYYAK